jgi:hypothetical protein
VVEALLGTTPSIQTSARNDIGKYGFTHAPVSPSAVSDLSVISPSGADQAKGLKRADVFSKYIARADLKRTKIDVDTESLGLVLLFSGAGLILTLAVAMYWPEFTTACLDRLEDLSPRSRLVDEAQGSYQQCPTAPINRVHEDASAPDLLTYLSTKYFVRPLDHVGQAGPFYRACAE